MPEMANVCREAEGGFTPAVNYNTANLCRTGLSSGCKQGRLSLVLNPSQMTVALHRRTGTKLSLSSVHFQSSSGCDSQCSEQARRFTSWTEAPRCAWDNAATRSVAYDAQCAAGLAQALPGRENEQCYHTAGNFM